MFLGASILMRITEISPNIRLTKWGVADITKNYKMKFSQNPIRTISIVCSSRLWVGVWRVEWDWRMKNIGSRGAELWFSDSGTWKYIRLHMLALFAPLLRLYLSAFSEVFTYKHGRRTQNPKCRLYWCLIEFVDWIYSQSCWYFRPLLWTVAPLPSLWPPPPLPPSQSKGGRVLSCVVGHILQEDSLFLTRFRTYKSATPPQTKTPVTTTFRDWCLYSSFVHAYKKHGSNQMICCQSAVGAAQLFF